MKFLYRLALCMLIVLFIIPLAGCPTEIEPEIIKSGDYFRVVISGVMQSNYDINFSEENTPTVSVTYQTSEDTVRTAVFQLDGYDEDKKIGYKLIVRRDKAQWKMDIEDGNMNVPYMRFYELIQTAALAYEYPVILIDISEYQMGTDYRSLCENDTKFFYELDSLLSTPVMQQWLENQ